MKWAKGVQIKKDPSDVIEVTLNFAPFLGADTIDTATCTSDDVDVDSSSVSGNVVTVWLSGGSAGSVATVKTTIVTTNATPRTIQRSFDVKIEDL
jgi:ribosomal protein S28E/S33